MWHVAPAQRTDCITNKRFGSSTLKSEYVSRRCGTSTIMTALRTNVPPAKQTLLKRYDWCGSRLYYAAMCNVALSQRTPRNEPIDVTLAQKRGHNKSIAVAPAQQRQHDALIRLQHSKDCVTKPTTWLQHSKDSLTNPSMWLRVSKDVITHKCGSRSVNTAWRFNVVPEKKRLLN